MSPDDSQSASPESLIFVYVGGGQQDLTPTI